MNEAERHETTTHPHGSGCPGCRKARICNVCGKALKYNRCTNGRCASCHVRYCGRSRLRINRMTEDGSGSNFVVRRAAK